MFPVFGGPALVALGSALGIDAVRRVGTVISAGTPLVLADIGLRRAVPGANDNATGVVALLEVARALAERPLARRARDARVDRSEESILEGMQAFGAAALLLAARERHVRPQPRHARLAAPDRAARRGDDEDVRVPASRAGPGGRHRRGARRSGCSRTCGCATRPTGWSRSRPAIRAPASARSPTTRRPRTTTGTPTRRRTSTTTRSPTGCGSRRRSSGGSTSGGCSPSSSRCTELRRRVAAPPRARRSRPRSAPRCSSSSSLPDLRARVDPELLHQLVAAHRRRRRAARASRAPPPASSRATSRWASIASWRVRAPRVASRSATDRSVTSSSTGSQARR